VWQQCDGGQLISLSALASPMQASHLARDFRHSHSRTAPRGYAPLSEVTHAPTAFRRFICD
jgi:hypothetical protein